MSLSNNRVVLIKKKRASDNEYIYHGKQFNALENYFMMPVQSKVLGIYKVRLNDLSETEVEFKEDEIKHKNLLFPTFSDENAVVMPILHYL